jgi:hypothetical protein
MIDLASDHDMLRTDPELSYYKLLNGAGLDLVSLELDARDGLVLDGRGMPSGHAVLESTYGAGP